MDEQVRELLHDVADEVPAHGDVPPRLNVRARRRIALRLGGGALVVMVLVFAGIAGVRSLSRSSGLEPAHNETPPPTPTSSATVTLSHDRCTYQGPEVVPAGAIRLRAVNETGKRLYVAVLSIEPNHSYDDLVAWIASPRGDEPPGWVTTLVEDEVPHGTSLVLMANVSPGTHAAACFTPHADRPVYSGAVGPITVAA